VTGARSIGRRLVRDLAIVYGLTLSLSVAVYMTVIWRGGSIEADRDQGRISHIVADALGRDPDGMPVLRDTPQLKEFRDQNSYFRVLVIDAETGVAARGSSAELLPLAQRGLQEVEFGELELRLPDQHFTSAVITTLTTRQGRFRLITVGARRKLYDVLHWIEAELEYQLLPLLVPLVVGSLGVAPWIVRRGLRPLAQLEREAEAITPLTCERRLDVESAPREMQGLIHAVNGALARLDDGFRTQRRFIANAAHELRTPIAVLRARLDEIGQPHLAAALKQDLRRMAILVDQLLVLARLQTRPPPFERLVLAELVRGVVAELAPLAVARGADISFDAVSTPVLVDGNADGLVVVLRNVIDNALRHAGKGGAVEVTVDAEGRIEVHDTGPGISDDDRFRMFEPFERGTQPVGTGAGLGLAIAREMLALHGGEIDVDNRDGDNGGAVFRIKLPLVA
jgi:signal transduction histidine kinase